MATTPTSCHGGDGKLAGRQLCCGDVSVFVSDTDFIEEMVLSLAEPKSPVEKLTLLCPFLGSVSVCISAREMVVRGMAAGWVDRLGTEPGHRRYQPPSIAPELAAGRSLSTPQRSCRRTGLHNPSRELGMPP